VRSQVKTKESKNPLQLKGKKVARSQPRLLPPAPASVGERKSAPSLYGWGSPPLGHQVDNRVRPRFPDGGGRGEHDVGVGGGVRWPFFLPPRLVLRPLTCAERKGVRHYVKTHFGNGHRLPLVMGNAPITDQVLQISQER
jgi:hypothetical protein